MRVRSSGAEGALALLLGLALVTAAPADPFARLYEHARATRVEGLEDALRALRVLEPQAAWGAYLDLGVRATMDHSSRDHKGSGSKGPLIGGRDEARRALDVLRLGHLHRHPSAVRAYQVLGELSAQQKEGLQEVWKAHRLEWIEDAGYAERQTLATLRNVFNLEPSLEPYYLFYRSNAERCWAQQQRLTLALALHPARTRTGVFPLTPELQAELVKEGHLLASLRDPGYGPGSIVHYHRGADGVVFCVQHGFHVPPEGVDAETSVRSQAEAAGITDPKILDRCADLPVVPRAMWGGNELDR